MKATPGKPTPVDSASPLGIAPYSIEQAKWSKVVAAIGFKEQTQ